MMPGMSTQTTMPLRRSGSWSRWTLAAAALMGPLATAGCGDILDVTDPDIINPSDVQSPAGAEAVRLGALGRFNAATGGEEGFFLLGGLMADEFINGDSFIFRQEIDRRTPTPENSFILSATRNLYRARLSAEQAVGLLDEYSGGLGNVDARVGEMHMVQGFVVNIMAEHFCSGLIFSTVVDGQEQYGSPITTTEALERALGHANDGLARATGASAEALRVRYALQVLRGRILLNLDRPADAAAAVSGVPTDFRYRSQHSQTTFSNTMWTLNNRDGRYSVSNGEGLNGLPFATADDPRVPVCEAGTDACRAGGVTRTGRDDDTRPLFVQLLATSPESPSTVFSGAEARMIEAEAALAAGQPGTALDILNAARATVGLDPLEDAGTPAARVDQLFRERAFWLFAQGTRFGDLRRLVRQYDRSVGDVFPTGEWHKGGDYSTAVDIPIPQAEENNPNFTGSCIARGA